MIEGVVNAAYEAVVTLFLRGPTGQEREIEAVIDTGYSGFLTLPPSLVEELGLPFLLHGGAVLANGDTATFGVHGVTILWDGRPRFIEADAVGPLPLAGMSLLDMHDLSIQVRDGGRVVIQPMA
ncbi:MAG: clan AA aspartic protease [Chloroflexi bacterium]|nr:clan AA aspartic protease [Chloroflexota bacterium]